VTLVPAILVSAEDDPGTQATPSSDRSPTYVRAAPAGALQLQIEPPAVGGVIVSDGLAGPGVIPASVVCPSGRASREFVDEGVIVKVAGPCLADSPAAVFETGTIPGLDIPDGEVQVDFKLVSGADRAQVLVFVRSELVDDCYRGYSPAITGRGAAAVLKLSGCGVTPILAERGDLAGKVRRDDWNTVAVRLEGPNIWVFLNDELILSLADSTFDHGGLNLRVLRTGDLNDTAESAVVFRNLRVAELAPRGSGADGPSGAP